MKQIISDKKEEKVKSTGEFITIIAHQLRTPLTGMKWSFDLLLSGEVGELSPEQKQIIRKVSSTTNYMIGLINNLLNVGQIEEGHFKIILKKQSILPVFKNVENIFKSIVEEKGVIFKIEIPTELPLLDIDIEKIEIVINNIIDNSIKYSLPGGMVGLKVTHNERELIISIKNGGVNIPREEFDKIFTKFFKSNQASQHKINAVGLGLYISKNIIDQHNGKIWFESEENQRTTFYISLPILK